MATEMMKDVCSKAQPPPRRLWITLSYSDGIAWFHGQVLIKQKF